VNADDPTLRLDGTASVVPRLTQSGSGGPLELVPRYAVDRLLDQGGMGEIWRVRDRDLERDVAVKVIHLQGADEAQLIQRFELEARITGQLDHPNIVPVHELGKTDGGRCYFTMKEVRGQSLAAVVRRVELADPQACAEWQLPRILQVLHRAAEAVAFAHHRGVIHRDLKPANIMVGLFGEVLVMDWGLARPIRAADAQSPASSALTADSQLTMAGAVLGTPSYMPPEQAGGLAVGYPADVYALGACLYELLTLSPPFRHENPMACLELVKTQVMQSPAERRREAIDRRRAPLPGIPGPVGAILAKCLERDPLQRYPDAGALAADLQRAIEGLPPECWREPRLARIARWARTHPVRAASAVTTALLGLILGLVVWQSLALQARRRLAEESRHARRQVLAQQQRSEALLSAQQLSKRLASDRQRELQAALRRREAFEHYQRGREIMRRRVRWRLAVNHLTRALKTDPSFAAARLERARALTNLGQAKSALADYRAQRSAAPRVLLYMGHIHRDLLDDLPGATRLYQQVVAADPNSRYAAVAQIYLLSLDGKFERARDGLRKLGSSEDHLWEVHLARATLYGTKRRSNPFWSPIKTVTHLTRAIRLRPGYCVLYQQRARMLERLQRHSEAVADYNRALGINARHVASLLGRAAVLATLHRHQEALKDLDLALKVSPSNTQALLQRGERYLYLGRNREAVRDLTRALRLQPDSWGAYSRRGAAYIQLQQFDKAERDYTSAVRLSGGRYWSLFNNRAILYLKLQKFYLAERDYSHALATTGSQKQTLYFNRGQMRAELKDFDGALADAASAIRRKDPQGTVLRALVLSELGQFRAAAALIDALRVKYPGLAERYRASHDGLRKTAVRWEKYAALYKNALRVRLAAAIAASFGGKPAEALRRWAPLLPLLSGRGGRIVFKLRRADLLAIQARTLLRVGRLPEAARAFRDAADATDQPGPAGQAIRGRRWLEAAQAQSSQPELDAQTLRWLRKAAGLGWGDAAYFRSLTALARLVKTPAFARFFPR